MAECVAEGVVITGTARRNGPAIVTDFVVAIERTAGTCPLREAPLRITEFGGKMPTGEAMGIAGQDPLEPGGRYIFLLENALSDPLPVFGPQGVLKVAPTAGSRAVVSDSSGQKLRLPDDRATAGEFEKVEAGDSKSQPEVDVEALFERLARATSLDSLPGKRLLKEATLARLTMVPRADAEAALRERDGPVTGNLSGLGPEVREVTCTNTPEPRGPNLAQCASSKYSHISTSGTAWNLPPNLVNSSPIANSIMVEWNKYANQFRVLTTPENNWGFNGRNDYGGLVASADLQRIHGYSWPSGVLGVTIFRSDFCVEITNEYFLGILINSYCSRRQSENDVFLNPAYTWTSDDLAVRLGLSQSRSIYSTLAHELGHGFGLGHSGDLALMTACDISKGWQPFPDDAAGARAKWPALATYGPNLGVRLLVRGADFTCASVTQPSAPRTNVNYLRATSQLAVGSFLVTNMNNAPALNVAIDWYLTTAPGGLARDRLIGTSEIASVAPGLASLAGPLLRVPPELGGTFYLVAVVRSPGGSSASTDGLATAITLVPRASIQFEQSTQSVAEASPSVALRVTRTGESAGAVTASYNTANGTGIAGTNYTIISGSVQWTDGDTTVKTITVPLRNDGLATPNRQFTVGLSSVTGAGVLGDPPVATVTLIDDRNDIFPLGCALPGRGWTHAPAGATAGWAVATDSLTEGRCSLKSASIPHGSSAVIQFTGEFSAGTIQFDRRVSSESSYDCLTFLVDNIARDLPGMAPCTSSAPPGQGVSGEQGWTAVSVPVTAGIHTLTWRYSKDGSLSRNSDAAWIDNLTMPVIEPVLRAVTITRSGGGSGTVASTPTGISCGSICAAEFVHGTVVTLTPTPSAGSAFTGWSGGGCTGTGTCVVTLNSAAAITAQFQLLSPALSWTAGPTTLAFGGQSMGTTSPSMRVIVTNTAAQSIPITSVAISAQYAVTHDCTTLAAFASCSVDVTFQPATATGGLNSALLVAGQLTLRSGSETKVVTLSGSAEKSLVTHYYRSILRRAPDTGGHAFWQAEAARVAGLGANINETWFALAITFFTSPEYVALNRDNAGYVTDLYRTFFNRSADAGGLAYWTSLLSQGMPREVVLVSFMFSPEFANFTQAIFGNTAARAEVDTVGDFYRGLLSRLPDSGGFNYWVLQFRNAQCLGASAVFAQVEAISSAYLDSPEYSQRGRGNAEFVADMYNAFLRRGGDLAGVQFWIGQLDSGARARDNIRQAFIATPEFGARVASVVAQGCQR